MLRVGLIMKCPGTWCATFPLLWKLWGPIEIKGYHVYNVLDIQFTIIKFGKLEEFQKQVG